MLEELCKNNGDPNDIKVEHSGDSFMVKLRRWWRRLWLRPYASHVGDYFLTVDFYYDPVDDEHWIYES